MYSIRVEPLTDSFARSSYGLRRRTPPTRSLTHTTDALAPNQITDYLVRVVQPKLQTVPGVQTAELLGQKVFALRAWLDPQKLAAYGLTATDVTAALAANDFLSGIGNTKGQMVH